MILFLFVKVFVSAAMVLGLTLIAERASPRVAGILSGYPLGVALAFFCGRGEWCPARSTKRGLYGGRLHRMAGAGLRVSLDRC